MLLDLLDGQSKAAGVFINDLVGSRGTDGERGRNAESKTVSVSVWIYHTVRGGCTANGTMSADGKVAPGWTTPRASAA